MAQVCPKCSTQNADDAYFCTACHAHIRSAFGAPASIAPPSTTPPAPVTSIFSAPAAVAEPVVAVEESVPEVPAVPATMTVAEEHSNSEPADPAPTFAELDNVNILEQLAIVSNGKVVPLQLQVPDRPTPVAPTRPTPAAPGGPAVTQKAFPAREHMNALPNRAGLYPEVSLKDMFPVLRALDTSQVTGTAVLPDGSNTSGLRDKAVLPAEAKGWSWAGFVPGGAFGFVVGMPALGLLGLLGLVTGRFGLFWLWPVYILIVGFKGREYAWRNKRFESVAQFSEMAGAWDKTGLALIIVDVVLYAAILTMAGAFNP